mgnify:CR=1 FL=1
MTECINSPKCPVQNPEVVFREEFDDWAVLFDPDTGETYGLDPVSAFVWKKLDGKHSIKEILSELAKACKDGVPDEAPKDVTEFVEDLTSKGLVGYKE